MIIRFSRQVFTGLKDLQRRNPVTRDAQSRVIAVDLRGSWAGDSDVAGLADIPALNRLDLSETRIGSSDTLHF